MMNDLKAIAIYLPQYHRVEENDKWWGEGFTEWTAVKQAEKLYEGHNQPRVPLNKNYYDLRDKKTLEWQAELAQQYGIFGFCFYHYYFKDGKKILEKPAEQLLLWKDIPMRYCFSWANMQWQRTWSNFTLGGSWASKFEEYNKEENPVLMQQDYGGEEQWKEHFEYLLPFFEDERYIKIDGKPVFIFHAVANIPCIAEMVHCWRDLAKKNGFSDLYLIGVVADRHQEYLMLDALYAQEPNALMSDYILYSDDLKKDICTRYLIYEDACRWGRCKCYKQKQKVFFSAFPGYDTTPRHGRRGIIIDKATPNKFENNFRLICRKSIQCGNEFVFINAWNEWGEGNYLEPDEKYGYGFLEAVRKVMSEDYQEYAVLEDNIPEAFYQVIREREVQRDRFKNFFQVLDQWMVMLENGKDIAAYFEKEKYQHIAIYGFGSIGNHLVNQLKGRVNVKCFIDSKVKIQNYSIPIYSVEEPLPEIDVVVVTAMNEYESAVFLLKNRVECNIVPLNEVITACISDR